MANRFNSPSVQFCDSTGAPLNAGTLSFFLTNSTTPQAVYSDVALSSSRGTIITLDSAGRAGNIFLSNLAYKVVLADSTGSQVWTADPVDTSDYSGLAQVNAWAGNPNGLVAGTAGTQGGLPSSMVWDVTNNVLYICTTTGVAAAAVWTAVNTSSVPAVPNAQGRLTISTGVPVMVSTVSGSTNVYYAPYIGRIVPVYNGTNFAAVDIGGELSQATTDTTKSPAAVGASQLYDMFVWSDSGTIRCTRGPTWATGGGSATARGTGAGSTALTLLNGIWVNTNAITNGPAAQRGTYVGTIASNASSTIDFIFGASAASGTAGSFQVWNMYNRVPIATTVQDATTGYTYTTATIRAADGSNTMRATYICGQNEDAVSAIYNTNVKNSTASATTFMTIGIGVDVTNAYSGLTGFATCPVNAVPAQVIATYSGYPGLGQHFLQACEFSTAAGTTTWNNTGGSTTSGLTILLRM